jgi:formylglycine-generating enzyme required for sulfatase activity
MVSVAGGTLPQSSELAGQVVAAFQIGKYEVTWGEWNAVRDWAVANNKGYDLAGVGAGNGDNFPVTNVSWHDVVKWSNARSEKEGLTPVYQVSGATYKTEKVAPTLNASANGYRLPSEKEWEWAARGGVSSKGYKYSGSNTASAVAWYSTTTSDDSTNEVRTKAVGTKAANELGIHDMSGNVEEWCLDVRINGGWWNSFESYVTIALRGASKDADYRFNGLGFRLARSSGN